MPTSLPISRLINVQVNLTPSAAQSQSLSDLLILGNSNVIDATERMRSYDSLAAVAADFGSVAPEYYAANLWFQQAPQPVDILIGRWVKTDSAAIATGAILTSSQQAIALWQAVTNGGFKITIDGAAQQNVTGLNFSAITNMNGVASVINAVMTGADATWDDNNQRFTIESDTAGVLSTITLLIAPTAGTDISAMLGLSTTSSGEYVTAGRAAETALVAVTEFENRFSQQWYAVMIPEITDADEHLAVAAFIQATDTKHLYGVTTQDTAVLSSISTSDIASELAALEYSRTMVQYSSSSAYAVASLLGRALTVDYNGNNTVITLMYKQAPGIQAELLTSSQMDALLDKNANVFVQYNNDTAIIQPGVMSSSDFIDIITGTDWMAVDLQTGVYNLLYTSPTKIPQTDAGMNMLCTVCAAVCSQGVTNGLLAPGTWQSQGFGTLAEGDFMPAGFYIYAAPIANQDSADRAARKAVPIQVAVKLAGAVHTADVLVTVNR